MADANCTRSCRNCGKQFVRTGKGEPTQYCGHPCRIECRKAEDRGRERKPVNRRLRPCVVCGKPEIAKELCSTHYMRVRAHGDPNFTLRGLRVEKPCGYCSKAMSLRPAQAKKTECCSRRCSMKLRASREGKRTEHGFWCAGCGDWSGRRQRSSKDVGKYCSRECYEAKRLRVATEVMALRRIAESWRIASVSSLVELEAGQLRRIASNWRKGWSPQVRRIRKCVDCAVMFKQRTHWGVPECRCASCKAVHATKAKAEWRKSPTARAMKARRKAIVRGLGRKADKIDPIAVFERDKWRCHLCGHKTLKAKRGTCHSKAPELDHIVTLADGGTHTWGNVACACRSCNGAKSARSMGQLGLGFAA